MKILMGPSGGTAATMGAYMQYFVEQNENHNHGIYLIPEIWRTMVGLTNRKLIPATPELVQGWDQIGGSPFIASCKDTNVFKIKKQDGTTCNMSGYASVFCNGYDGVIAVGGGGTTAQSTQLNQDHHMNFIVPLATMDNDVSGFDNILGYQTAVERCAASITACASDAWTMNRPTMVFTMGYDCGRVAVGATKFARKNYGAKIDLLNIPETGTDIEYVAYQIRKLYKGGAFTAVFSEGVCKTESGTNDGIHKKFGTDDYAQKLIELTGIKFKVLHPDYMQRSGFPVEADKKLAKDMACETHRLIDGGYWNYVIGSNEGKVISRPFDEVIENLEKQKSYTFEWYRSSLLSLDDVSDILIR